MLSIPTLMYVHGFASGPSSTKAERIAGACDRLGIPFAAPDLNVPRFYDLSVPTMAHLLALMLRSTHGPTLAIAGSLGSEALLAALTRFRTGPVSKAVLLAPVLGHRKALLRIAGRDRDADQPLVTDYDHYWIRERLPLSSAFTRGEVDFSLSDLGRIQSQILIMSATRDRIADPADAELLVSGIRQASLVRLNADHQFVAGFEDAWQRICDFFGFTDLQPIEISNAVERGQTLSSRRLDTVIRVIQDAYGETAYSRHLHRRRILEPGTLVITMRDEIRLGSPLMAAAYIRRDGKVGALGVLPPYRGMGLASRMLRSLQTIMHRQFIEVNEDDLRTYRVALKSGFRPTFAESALQPILSHLGLEGRLLEPDSLGVRYERLRGATGRRDGMRLLARAHFDMEQR